MRTIETLDKILAQAIKDVAELKNKQFIGKSNVVVYDSQSLATWDINQNVTLTSGPKKIVLYFIADAQVAPFCEFNPEIQLDNVPYNTSTDNRLNYLDFGLDEVSLNTLNLTAEQFKRFAFYTIAVSNSSYPVTINVKVKIKVLSTDRGTVAGFIA